jgi:hypothetical protein
MWHACFTCRVLPVAVLALTPSLALADGGTVRLSQQKGAYRITVFTAPTTLRPGLVDVSVLVQDSATGEPALGAQVTIKVERRGLPRMVLVVPATTQAATNKLYHATAVELPVPGSYAVEVCIDGASGKAQVHFEAEVAEPLPRWQELWPWVLWPVPAIILFGMHQILVRRRSPSPATPPHN